MRFHYFCFDHNFNQAIKFIRRMKSIFFLLELLYVQESKEKQPNIIFIVADDLGWADVNWNNKEIFQIVYTREFFIEYESFDLAYG